MPTTDAIELAHLVLSLTNEYQVRRVSTPIPAMTAPVNRLPASFLTPSFCTAPLSKAMKQAA